jgi:hypothetical protein
LLNGKRHYPTAERAGNAKNKIIRRDFFGLAVNGFGYAAAAPLSLALRRSSRSALIFAMVGSSSL